MQELKKSQEKIILLLQKDADQVTIEDYQKYMNVDESDLSFTLLRKYLITKGLAVSLVAIFIFGKKIENPIQNYNDPYEVCEFENAIEDLYRLGVFDQNDINIELISKLFDQLKDLKVIKGQVLNYKLSQAPESIFQKATSDLFSGKRPIKVLKERIKKAAKTCVEEAIEQKEGDLIVTDKEVDDEYKSLMQKLKWVSGGASVITSIANPLTLSFLPFLLMSLLKSNKETKEILEG